MEFIVQAIAGMLRAAGGWFAAVIAAIAALGSAVVYHRHKVSKAEDQGQEDGAAIERDRISREAEQITDYLEQRKDEIEQEVARDTATDDDLRDRMRRNARPTDPGSE